MREGVISLWSARIAEWGECGFLVWAGSLFTLSASWEDVCVRAGAYEEVLAPAGLFLSGESLWAVGKRLAAPTRGTLDRETL